MAVQDRAFPSLLHDDGTLPFLGAWDYQFFQDVEKINWDPVTEWYDGRDPRDVTTRIYRYRSNGESLLTAEELERYSLDPGQFAERFGRGDERFDDGAFEYHFEALDHGYCALIRVRKF